MKSRKSRRSTPFLAALKLVCLLTCVTGTRAFAEPPPGSPAAVVDSFVSKLIAIAPKYPELSGFKEYAAGRKDRLRIHYEKGFTPFKDKRYVKPDDFADKGMLLVFSLTGDRLPMAPQATGTTRHLTAYHLILYADFQLSSSPSAGLQEELKTLISEHVTKLDKLSEKAANRSP